MRSRAGYEDDVALLGGDDRPRGPRRRMGHATSGPAYRTTTDTAPTGLNVLRVALREAVDVVVCAPETEQSATSHSLSLSRPLRLGSHGEGVFSVDGTPADCVYVALNSGSRLLPRAPDLVVSGLNHGLNLGTDVFYSGTVAAAREGALRGYPALAVSAARDCDFVAAAAVARKLALGVLAEPEKKPGLLLNVNFPHG